MKRKLVILLAAVTCAALFLSAGKPKLIGEDEAKEIGLAFINHVFDVNETEATVTYATQAGATYLDGEYKQTGDEQPIYYYVVATSQRQDGMYDYNAFVNAETGVAYAAEQNYAHVPKMTLEQREKWSEAYGNGDSEAIDYLSMNIDCYDFAREWISQTFDLNARILGIVDSGSLFDPSGANTNFYVVIRDGTIYHVTMAWPQMTVVEVTILNQTRPTGDVP
ncbi:MAG: hypothetical protein GX417_09175 [Clostridiales bacterium]|nr:hypothetical protein [Clostridiales bacterium]